MHSGNVLLRKTQKTKWKICCLISDDKIGGREKNRYQCIYLCGHTAIQSTQTPAKQWHIDGSGQWECYASKYCTKKHVRMPAHTTARQVKRLAAYTQILSIFFQFFTMKTKRFAGSTTRQPWTSTQLPQACCRCRRYALHELCKLLSFQPSAERIAKQQRDWSMVGS